MNSGEDDTDMFAASDDQKTGGKDLASLDKGLHFYLVIS